MKVRRIEEKDLETIGLWCKDWNYPDISKLGSALPEFGIIIEDENEGIIAGYVYITNSVMAYSEHIISNKKFKDKGKRSEAKKILFLELENYAKSLGRTILMMGTGNVFLIKKMTEELGFIKCDINMTHLIKIL